nr:hypothetical protein [Tanacetum cinerariifolium]
MYLGDSAEGDTVAAPQLETHHQLAVDTLGFKANAYALPINPTVYVSHIRHFWSTARIKTTNEETKILTTVDGKHRTISESSLRRHLKLNNVEGISSIPDTELFENLSLMGYNILPNPRFTFQKGQFSHQWKFLIHTIMQCLSPKSTGFNEFSSNITTAVAILLKSYTDCSLQSFSPAVDEPAYVLKDDSQGEAFPTVTSLDAGHDRENIIKTSALPHESTPRVTSLDADEGSMQQQLQKLMDLCTDLQRQQTQMANEIKAQDLEISSLKAMVKILEDKDRGKEEPQEDAPIKGGGMEIGEEVEVERITELGSNDTEEMVNVLSAMEAANILTSGVATVSVPLLQLLQQLVFPLEISARDKGKEKVVEFDVPKKKKLQEQINAQVAREMEEEFARDNQRLSKQLARDSKIARLHVEEELKMMIEGLDRSNEMIVKHLQEYEQAAADLTIREKIELINELVKYQDHHAKILKYQAQQQKPFSKKEQREFYMKGLKLDQGSSKRMKISDDVSKEDLKGMMQLVHVEEVYVEALQVKHSIINCEIYSEGKKDYWKIIRLGEYTAVYQLGEHTAVYQFFVDMLKQFDREDLHQLWALVKETLSIRHATKDKENELCVELKRLFEPDIEDQLWTHTQNLMHDPLDWKLYDKCGVHHVFTKDQEILCWLRGIIH